MHKDNRLIIYTNICLTCYGYKPAHTAIYENAKSRGYIIEAWRVDYSKQKKEEAQSIKCRLPFIYNPLTKKSLHIDRLTKNIDAVL